MSEFVSSARDWRRTHLFVTHAPETLLGCLVLGRLLVVAMADAPALAVDHGLCDPKRSGIGALGDCIIKDPLNWLVVLLQALVEEAEVADGGRIGERPAGFWWWRWRAMARTRDGRIELVVRAGR